MKCEVFLSSSISLDGAEGEILLDYSKNIITKKTMELLFSLVRNIAFVCLAKFTLVCRQEGVAWRLLETECFQERRSI